MYGIIYEAHNIVSLKNYVGQSWRSLAERKRIHFNRVMASENNNYFHNALRKYDKSIWEWKVLGCADCQSDLDTLEKSWMWIKDSMAPNGYNTKEGGSHGKHTAEGCGKISKGLTGRKLTEEHCRHISEGKKGKNNTKEHNKNISKAKKGNTNGCGNKDKKRTTEQRKDISESLKGKYMGAEHPRAKAVICMETEIVYGAISEAARETSIHLAGIWTAASGKRKTAGGFHWEFIKV